MHRAHAKKITVGLPRRGLQQKIRVAFGGDTGEKKLRAEKGIKVWNKQRSR